MIISIAIAENIVGAGVTMMLATISVTIFNVPSITISEINHDVFI